MPTLKPRISVTVSEDVYASISRLAMATNKSVSNVVCEVLEGVAPTFDQVSKVVEAAAIAQRTMGTRIFKEFDQAEKTMTRHLKATQTKLTATNQHLLDLVDKPAVGSPRGRPVGTRSAPSGRPGAEPTPLSNRGVTNPKDDRTITKVTVPKSVKTASKASKQKVGG